MVSSPYLYLDSTGVIVPDTEEILSGVQQEIQAALGSDTVVTPDTPQGLLAVAEALARAEVVQNNAVVANQINPNINGGIFQDAVGFLTGIERTPATQTVVPGVSMTGVAGTIIPTGTQAQTAAGDLFSTLETITLAIDGTGTVDFASVTFGPIPCGAGDLVFIVTNVLGWETVNNMVAGVIGQNTQSDQSFRAYRNNTLAFQGVALPVANTSALYNVAGLQSLSYLENYTASDTTINGIFLVKNSIYVCVNGGSDVDVAAALLENKSSGCNWNGATTVAVTEPASGQIYSVKFDRATQIGIAVRVTTPNGNSPDVIQAVLDYAAGLVDGLQGFIVGSDVSPFEIAAAIADEVPGIFISKVEISLESSISYSTNVIAIALNQIAFTQTSYISVVNS